MIGAIIGAGASLLGSMMGAHSQSNANKKNLELMKLQNQMNKEQWQRENVYNSPANQMKRLAEAGINPNLAYSNGGLMNTAASSPNMQAGQVNPIQYNLPSMGEVANAFNSSSLIESQKKNVDADTAAKNAQAGNTNVSTELLRSDLAFRDALNHGALELQSSQITLNQKMNDVKDVEIKKLRYECGLIQHQTENLETERERLKALISNIDADTAKKKIDAFCQSKLLVPQIRELEARAGLSRTQAEDLLRTQFYRIAGLQISNDEIQTRNYKMRVEADRIQFDLSQDAAFQSTERSLQMVNSVVQTSSSAIGNLFGFLKGGKK